jgi:isoleucyl-tRNA synthetase
VTEAKPSKEYKSTLNLPQTEFQLHVKLPERESEQVERWLKERTYYRMVERNRAAKAPRFLLHDGPPYANGNIHIGHALNKVLKDVVVKYKNLAGFDAAYVPGWDCHGLPIELGVEKQLIDAKRDKNAVPITELRQMCRDYASKYIEIQKAQFQRLEVFGDWDDPYVTMSKEYVSGIVRELGRCSKAGVLYQGNKPVYWCANDGTALAEAEIEYADKTSPSIYVKFDLTREALASFPELQAVARKEGAVRTALVIWTTTPWTLPANLGIALHPEFEYVAIKAPTLEGTEIWIVAAGLQEAFERAAGMGEKTSTPLLTFKAEKLHKQHAQHPFIEGRKSLIMLGDHVTLEAGTGAVHTAPGHGVDDYRIGSRYGLDVYAPVDDRGRFTADFPEMQGQFIFKANEGIIQMLQSSGHLVARQDLNHSYPHCWRCNKPVIFRATPQWFIRMDSPKGSSGTSDRDRNLRKEAEAAIRDVEWIPAWGINRILGMIESRPDWCISRQRAWGVPITVFYCTECDEPKADEAVFNHVADLIREKGTDVWFTEPVEKLLPKGAKCAQCQSTSFKKEKDILDVWFDSGVSHASVMEERELGWPADLYLEGSDQHRGWFQTSLLTAVATRRRAPFKKVLTHGFVNDKDGKKMSKSKGNVTSPLDIMKQHGAEILRMWVVLEDYRNDVNFSAESLKVVGEAYRKIRNTMRFMLGNLPDFDPGSHRVPRERLGDLDRWALSRAAAALEKITAAYDAFEFHAVYHTLTNLCSVELSATYFDILKDRLYTARKDSAERRSSQTAMWLIANALTRAIAPILSFTAEELWAHVAAGEKESVFFSRFPSGKHGLNEYRDPQLEARFESVWTIRGAVTKALEEARQAKTIGHSREAKVTLTLDPGASQVLKGIQEDPKRLFLVSELELRAGDALSVQVGQAAGAKCARCWTYSSQVGCFAPDHPELCERCMEAIR